MFKRHWVVMLLITVVAGLLGAGAIVASIEINRQTATDAFCTSCHSMAGWRPTRISGTPRTAATRSASWQAAAVATFRRRIGSSRPIPTPRWVSKTSSPKDRRFQRGSLEGPARHTGAKVPRRCARRTARHAVVPPHRGDEGRQQSRARGACVNARKAYDVRGLPFQRCTRLGAAADRSSSRRRPAPARTRPAEILQHLDRLGVPRPHARAKRRHHAPPAMPIRPRPSPSMPRPV